MRFLTDFADQAVVLPLVITIGVSLWFQGWRRGAIAWMVVIGTTFTAMVLVKVVAIDCSHASPSGHTAAAAVVSGGLCMLLLLRRQSVLFLALLVAIVIGVSRVWIGVHTPPEVIVGAVVGLTGAVGLLKMAGPPPALDLKRIALIVLLVAVMMHGFHLPAEARIHHVAMKAKTVLGLCQ